MADFVTYNKNCKHKWVHRKSEHSGILFATWDWCSKCNSEKNRKVRGVDF